MMNSVALVAIPHHLMKQEAGARAHDVPPAEVMIARTPALNGSGSAGQASLTVA
jgi:hypothetical protein